MSTESSPPTTGPGTVELSDERLSHLRRFNAAIGGLHLVSGLAMVALANDFELSVSTLALNGPPGTPLSEGTVHDVADIPLAWASAAFLFLSAFFHFLVASPIGIATYASEIRAGRPSG